MYKPEFFVMNAKQQAWVDASWPDLCLRCAKSQRNESGGFIGDCVCKRCKSSFRFQSCRSCYPASDTYYECYQCSGVDGRSYNDREGIVVINTVEWNPYEFVEA